MNFTKSKTTQILVLIVIISILWTSSITPAMAITYAKNEQINEYTFMLNSNNSMRNVINLYMYNNCYFILLDDLCELTRCSYRIKSDMITITQGIWSATIDYNQQLFDDGWQSVDMEVILKDDSYLVPALEFLTYFGSNSYIDLDTSTLYCIMPECTAWEALDVNYNDTLIDVYELYGGEKNVRIKLTLDIIMDFFLSGSPSTTKYLKNAYDEALSINLYDYTAINDYHEKNNTAFYDYIISDEGQNAANFTMSFLDHSISGIEYLSESYYNISNVKFADLVSNSYNQGLFEESTHYAEQILNGYRENKSISNLATIDSALSQVVLVFVQTALESSQELKYVAATNNLAYYVMGSENTSYLGLDVSDNDWFSIADTYKNASTITSSNLLKNATNNFVSLGWDQLIGNSIESFTGTSAFLWTFSKDCATLFAKVFPPTSSNIKAFEADRLALYLSELQQNVYYVITNIDFNGNYNKEDLFQKYIEAELLYCRVSIAMYENLIISSREFNNNKDNWEKYFQKRIDELAVSMYKLTMFQDDGVSSCCPLDLISLTNFSGTDLEDDVTANKLHAIFSENADLESEIYFFYDDFDGDGKGEAYGLTGYYSEMDELYIDVSIYFISSDGTCQYLNQYEELHGFLSLDSLLSVGDHKFLIWELSANGSASLSYIYGVKNGHAYEPEISRQYMCFATPPEYLLIIDSLPSSDTYVGYKSDFSKGFHDYIPHYFRFDKEQCEFIEQ